MLEYDALGARYDDRKWLTVRLSMAKSYYGEIVGADQRNVWFSCFGRGSSKIHSKTRQDHPTPEQERVQSALHGPGPSAFAGFPERTCPKGTGRVSY